MRRTVIRVSLVVGATIVGPVVGFALANLPGVVGGALFAAAVDAWQFLELDRELAELRQRTRPLTSAQQMRADEDAMRRQESLRRAADPFRRY